MPHVELSLVDRRRLAQHPPPDQEQIDPPAPRQPDRSRAAGNARATRDVPPPPAAAPPEVGSLQRWAAAVAGAAEPCLVLDADSVIVAASAACVELLGCDGSTGAHGKPVRDAVVHLVDFTDPPDKLDSAEADKIPPLLAISSRQLARGLIRVALPDQERACIVDAVATPLWEDGAVVGSLTFFSPI